MRTLATMLALLICISPLLADWPVFRGNAAMSGTASAKLPDKLEEIWTFSAKDTIEGAPAVVDGVVYVATMGKMLFAIDLATGKEIWSTKLEPMRASPAVNDGKVIIGDVNGKVYCLDAKTGKELWTFETGGEITAGANFHKGNILIGSHDSSLYCLSPDGKKLWELQIDGPVNGSPAVVGDKTFVAGCDRVLHVVDANTGKSIGGIDIGGEAGATAAVADKQIFVGTMSNQVVAVNWQDEKLLWEFESPRRQQPFYASAAITDKVVVAGSRDKKLYAIDIASGKELWQFVTEGMIDASPVIVGDKVYFGSLSSLGDFYVVDLNTGRLLQTITLDSAVSGSAAVVGDKLLVGTDKGTLYCLGAK